MKANRKLSALRLCRFYNFGQRRLLMKYFIESQFAYSPLVWMFHDRGFNNKINKLHERTLRFVYQDDISSFEELLNKDKSVTVHHRNIHAMAIEMFKCLNGVGTEIMNDIFIRKENASNRQMRFQKNFLPQVNIVHYGHDSLRYFGCKIWDKISKSLRILENSS